MGLAAVQKTFMALMRANPQEPYIPTHLFTTTHAKQRITIYHNSHLGCLQRTLARIFPVCVKLVGENFFLTLAAHYIHQHPSASPLLIGYGEYFPSFIKNYAPAAELPYLSEIADLEYHWHKVFYSRNNNNVNFAELNTYVMQQGDQIILQLPQDAILFTSTYPVTQIWESCQAEYDGDFAICLTPNRFYYLLWQENYRVRMEVLTPNEHQVLMEFKSAQSLLDICNKLIKITTGSIEQLLLSLLQRGCIRILSYD